MLLHGTAVTERSRTTITEDEMNTTAQETTAHLPVVRSDIQPTPFKPPRYSYGFADRADATQIAALAGHYPLELVRDSLRQGNDEWIIARRGEAIVAAIHVRAEPGWQTHKIHGLVVAEPHQRCGLERYLTHLAELWIQSINLPAAA